VLPVVQGESESESNQRSKFSGFSDLGSMGFLLRRNDETNRLLVAVLGLGIVLRSRRISLYGVERITL
jgi:hypothetical protein